VNCGTQVPDAYRWGLVRVVWDHLVRKHGVRLDKMPMLGDDTSADEAIRKLEAYHLQLPDQHRA
jgi:hypothetical protein